MSAEEHFSGFKKDIKSKFVSEDAIRGTTFEEEVAVEKVDNRPLYQRLAEKRQKQDDGNFCIDQEINEIYRLANRIRKLDEDEILFYEQIDSEQKEKEDLVKQIEREGLEKFRASAENIAKKVSYNAPSSVVKKPFR
jgi:transcription initiation factor IIF auxiliary subunit